MQSSSALVLGSFAAMLALPLGGALAQTESTELLTMEEALSIAEERSPRVRVARAAREAASAYATLGTQTRVRNPVVAVRAMVGQPDAPAATYSALVGMPFDLSQRRAVWRREALLLADRADADLLAAQNDARAEARLAFIALYVAEARVAVQENREAVSRGIVARVEAQLEAEASTAYELSLAERELAEAEADVLAARVDLESARGQLRQALDLDPLVVPRVVAPELPTMPEGLSLERAVELAERQRREPMALRALADRYRTSERRLRAEVVDPLFVGVEFEAQGNRSTQSTVGASVGFNLPVVFTNRGERHVALATADATDVESEVVERTIAREAATAYRMLEQHVLELGAIDTRAVPAAERAVELTEARLAAGAVDLFQVLSNRRDLFALRAHRLDVLKSAWLARIALDRAIGSIWEGAP